MKKCLVSIICVLFAVEFSFAGTVHQFHLNYSYEDGFPESAVQDCCQDNFGRMWIATLNGVYVSNGPRFTTFQNPTFLKECSKFTLSIEEDISHNIWISTSHGVGFYNTESGEFTAIEELFDTQIIDIDTDKWGKVWLTSSEGIWVYDLGSGNLTKRAFPVNISPYRICRMNDDYLIILSDKGSLFLYDDESGAVSPLEVKSSGGRTFSLMNKINESLLLLSSYDNQVFTLDINTGEMTHILSTEQDNHLSMVTSMMVYNGEYWIGTSSGIIIYNPITGETDNQSSGETASTSLVGQIVLSLFHDREGNVWAGTFNGGLRCSRNYHGSFGRVISNDGKEGLRGKSVRSICEDNYGYIWIGSDDGNLCRLDRRTGRIEQMSARAGIRQGTTITAIRNIDGMLCIGTFGDGVIGLDPKTLDVMESYSIADNRCLSILQARNDDVYFGTSRGLYRKKAGAESVEFISQIGSEGIHCLAEDEKGQIWIGSYGDGIGIFNPSNTSYKILNLSGFERGNFLKYINYIGIENDNCLWVGSNGSGLCKIGIDNQDNAISFKEFSENTGFPFSDVSSYVMQDKQMWVETNDGVVRFNTASDEIVKIYFQSDKVIGNNFQEGACCQTRDGVIYMGSRKGMIYFKPNDLQYIFDNGNIEIYSVSTSSGQVSKEWVEDGRSILTSNKIRIPYKEANVLELTFGLTDIESPNRLRYDCRLNGFLFRNELTTYQDNVSYPGLRPGKYSFTVKVHGSTHERLSKTVTIVIPAPWYQSNVAMILYMMAIIGAIVIGIRARKKNLAEDRRRMGELETAEKQRQLLRDKMDFMTNITHEIKTPVSLISILVDKLTKGKTESGENASDYSSLKSSTNRLFELCNELLEFRKLNDGKIQLSLTETDLAGIARSVSSSFAEICGKRGITFNTEVPDTKVIVNGDTSALETIVSNLMSNAVKYCEKEIHLRLVSDGQSARLTVDSDGKRIPKEESEQIFDAFFQSKTINSSGTGLGLTFSRNLAGLQNGKLYLDTEKSDFNSFVFTMPIVSEPSVQVQEEEEPVEPIALSGENTGKARVLVVEDNSDLRKVIRNELKNSYYVKTAADGSEALDIVRNDTIDIVVSDIMMPVMDGCEMCNRIKSDIEYSHILVILLTAATGVESHIKSLQAGADSYIEKPFKMEILKANIENLLKNRAIRNEQFSHSPFALVSSNYSSSVEHDFMERLHETVMDNISDTEFSASSLVELMKTNRKAMIAKIKANTGLGITEYIRVCRLRKAAELLAEKKYRVNEVAYLVGYTSPSYFTQQFQAQFGVKPSDFVKEKKWER